LELSEIKFVTIASVCPRFGRLLPVSVVLASLEKTENPATLDTDTAKRIR